MPEYDASDPKQVQDAKSTAGRRRKDDDDVIRKLLETGAGRSWMWRFLIKAHVLANPFDAESERKTAFSCGEMNLGLQLLLDIMRAAPDSYLLMMKENQDGT